MTRSARKVTHLPGLPFLLDVGPHLAIKCPLHFPATLAVLFAQNELERIDQPWVVTVAQFY